MPWYSEYEDVRNCIITGIVFYIIYILIMKKHLTLFNIARVVAAVILLQTLFYKFTAHPESVALFTQIGMEPWGRIWTGVIELIVGLLLLFWRNLIRLWALGVIVLMIWAIYFHIIYLWINALFWMAIVVIVCACYVLWKCKSGESCDC